MRNNTRACTIYLRVYPPIRTRSSLILDRENKAEREDGGSRPVVSGFFKEIFLEDREIGENLK